MAQMISYEHDENILTRLKHFLKRQGLLRSVNIVALIAIALVLPFTLLVASKRQEIRQHAAGTAITTGYLSDQQGTVISNGWGPMEKDMSNGDINANDGKTITLNGVAYQKGLGVHAASEIVYPIGGTCSTFVADVGLDDEVDGQTYQNRSGSVDFQVLADGTKIFDSGVMTASSPTQHISVSLIDKNELRLIVTDGGDGNTLDHADWAGAKVTCATSSSLSDLPITVVSNGWGPVEKDMSNGESNANDGQTLTLNGTTYAKGLGVHAASEITYNTNGSCSTFTADVGLDDEVDGKSWNNKSGSVIFQVFVDGTKQFDSGVMLASSQTQHVSVLLSGKNQLKLVVTDAGDGNTYDHGDWANAQVLCGAALVPFAVTNLSVKDTKTAAYWSIQTNLQNGNLAFGDRNFTLDNIPSNLIGQTWIRTANDSKKYTGNPLATFTINQQAPVYIAWDTRMAKPSWLDSSWTDTKTTLTIHTGSVSGDTKSALYTKTFPEGTVSLAPIGSTNTNMYLVFFMAPASSAPIVPTGMLAAPTPTSVVPPTPTPTNVVPPTPTPTSSLNTNAMPVGDLPGWRQIFTEDFNTNASVGQFRSIYGSKFSNYNDGWETTTHTPDVRRCSSRVVSVANGIMTFNMHAENLSANDPCRGGSTLSSIWLTAVEQPAINSYPVNQLYGKYAIRFRVGGSLHGHYLVPLLWPQSGYWPKDGEIDFPEGGIDGNIQAYLHNQDGTSPGDQQGFSTNVPFSGGWHIASTEWDPVETRFILDGNVIGRSSTRIPNTPMRYVLQTETCWGSCPTPGTSATIDFDWVVMYAKN